MSGQANFVTGSALRALHKGTFQVRAEDPLSAFTQTFNGGKEIAAAGFFDRFAGQIRWMSGGRHREGILQMSMRHAAHCIAGNNPLRAEKATYAFARQLLYCGFVDEGDEAMILGAKRFLGESTSRVLDLSDEMLRELVFARLVAAGLAVETDTSMFPPEWGLGKRWALIKHPLDLGQFDEESRKFVGIDLLQRKIDPSRPDVERWGKPQVPYRRDERQIREYHDAWISALNTLERAGVSVARPDHEVSYNVSVRLWRKGARKWNLHYPLVGLNKDGVRVANEAFDDVVARVRDIGLWKTLADWQVARNLVYDMSSKPEWVAIEP